jgi:hypothetical protein
MIYGGTIQAEQEAVIRLDRLDQQAHICSTWPEWSRKLERPYGAPRKVTQRDGKVTSAFWTVPLNRVSLRRGTPRRRTLTAEERQSIAARLQNARSSRAGTTATGG